MNAKKTCIASLWLTAACITPVAAHAQADAAAANDSLVPRTYMDHTVMAVPLDASTPRPLVGFASSRNNPFFRFNGAVQTEFLIPQDDKGTGAGIEQPYGGDVLNNTYIDLSLNNQYISFGGRFQWAKWPLPGYENDFKGWGVPYLWATGAYKWAKLTVGDFYEQFGSGFILRTYEERSLGVDNAIRGGRLKLNPAKGLNLTALGGKQRRYWEHNSSWLWGADAEWSINESFARAFQPGYGLTVGVSYVGKHEKDEEILTEDYSNRLNLPRNVAAFDARVKVKLKDFNILAEAATKNNDPTEDNGYTYRRGSAVMLSTTYASKGFSALLQAKRSDNMSFRSKRSIQGISSYVNHLPAFTLTQTYALAAMYPYATQPDGEWAFQGEVRYLFKRGTALGGKYGTNVRLSGSYISGLNRNKTLAAEDAAAGKFGPIGSNGYGAAFWKMGSLYYADVNFELNKKLNKKLQFTLFYLFQKYNQTIVEGHGGMVNSNIFILEGQWKMSKKCQLRWELQYLQTKQDKGDWMAALVEFSLAPHWMFTFTDQYNVDPKSVNAGEKDYRLNYYNALVTYSLRANRFSVGYGRTKAGYNCSGGVCRWVPASKGFSITYNYTF